MTREEAKNILRNAAWLGTHDERNKTEEAVEMAIMALSGDKIVDCPWCGTVLEHKPKDISAEEYSTYDKFIGTCDDAVSIRKDALKTRVGNIVAYNVEWLKKHWQMEMDIVCGVKPCDDATSREWLMRKATERFYTTNYFNHISAMIEEAPSVTQKSGKWIPVSERLPEDLEPVNITWVNHNPERYYEEFKDKPFTATGHYCKGRWYWYSSVCQDYLEEYGRCDFDEIDTDIEVIAWIPLPKPYEPQESEE